MVLDARHRSEIYQVFVPLMGVDNANALMSEFRSYDGEELVTKEFLRAELALTKGELRAEIADLRVDIGAVENRLTLRLGGAIVAATTILGALSLLD